MPTLVCLPKHNYLLTVEPRAVDPHCFDADPEPVPDPAQNLDVDPDSDLDPDPGGGGGQPKMCIPPGKILSTPLGGGGCRRSWRSTLCRRMPGWNPELLRGSDFGLGSQTR
jgi:hypothetical protein